MPSENSLTGAIAHLRTAGLSEPAARTLAGRVVGVTEQLRRQAEVLPSTAEPATLFSVVPRAPAKDVHQ